MIAVYEGRAPLSLRFMKQAVYGGAQMGSSDAIKYESYIVSTIYQTDDKQEGVRSFLIKCQPRFTGNKQGRRFFTHGTTMKRFEGKTAAITGAARGIGLGAARALAHEGCAIAILDRDLGAAREAAQQIASSSGSRVVAIEVDITRPGGRPGMSPARRERACATRRIRQLRGDRGRQAVPDSGPEDWRRFGRGSRWCDELPRGFSSRHGGARQGTRGLPCLGFGAPRQARPSRMMRRPRRRWWRSSSRSRRKWTLGRHAERRLAGRDSDRNARGARSRAAGADGA